MNERAGEFACVAVSRLCDGNLELCCNAAISVDQPDAHCDPNRECTKRGLVNACSIGAKDGDMAGSATGRRRSSLRVAVPAAEGRRVSSSRATGQHPRLRNSWAAKRRGDVPARIN